MQLSDKTIEIWKASFEYSLPGLIEAIKEVSSDTFLIGASLLDLYKTEGWVPDFSCRVSPKRHHFGLSLGHHFLITSV